MAMNNMADKEHADKACPLCGGRVMWFPASRHWCCEHCRNTFNGFTVFPEPKTREPNGNAAKLREALKHIKDRLPHMLQYMRVHWEDANAGGYFDELMLVIDAALAAPPRNCDIYSHDEALNIWAAETENERNGCFDEWLYHDATEKEGGDK